MIAFSFSSYASFSHENEECEFEKCKIIETSPNIYLPQFIISPILHYFDLGDLQSFSLTGRHFRNEAFHREAKTRAIFKRINEHTVTKDFRDILGKLPYSGLRIAYSGLSLKELGDIFQLITLNKVINSVEIYNTAEPSDPPYEEIGDKEIKDIELSLIENSSLTSIHLQAMALRDKGAEAFASVLKHNKVLTSLSICNDYISNKGVNVFSEALRSNKSLTYLGIHNNDIGDSGIKDLADALVNNNTLKRIDLSGNQISELGAKSLSNTLSFNRSVEQLDINNISITDNIARFLFKFLQYNQHVKILSMSYNDIDDVIAAILIKNLKLNKVLTSLSLQTNKISDIRTQAFISLLEEHPTLKLLNLSNNSNISGNQVNIIRNYNLYKNIIIVDGCGA